MGPIPGRAPLLTYKWQACPGLMLPAVFKYNKVGHLEVGEGDVMMSLSNVSGGGGFQSTGETWEGQQVEMLHSLSQPHEYQLTSEVPAAVEGNPLPALVWGPIMHRVQLGPIGTIVLGPSQAKETTI